MSAGRPLAGDGNHQDYGDDCEGQAEQKGIHSDAPTRFT